MAGVHVPGSVQRLLVQRCGADGLCLARKHQIHRLFDKLKGPVSRNRRNHAKGMPRRYNRHIKAINVAGLITGIFGAGNGMHQHCGSGYGDGFAQALCIAHNQSPGPRADFRTGHGLNDYFRADARGIAHGDGHHR